MDEHKWLHLSPVSELQILQIKILRTFQSNFWNGSYQAVSSKWQLCPNLTASSEVYKHAVMEILQPFGTYQLFTVWGNTRLLSNVIKQLKRRRTRTWRFWGKIQIYNWEKLNHFLTRTTIYDLEWKILLQRFRDTDELWQQQNCNQSKLTSSSLL